MDEDGFFKVVGRIKDMILRGGENVYPTEIEDFLHSHPKIDDVQVLLLVCMYLAKSLVVCYQLKHAKQLLELHR